jgi:hypothetical protein
LPSLQYFRDPNPGYRIVMDEVSTFVGEVARSLRAGVNRLCSFSFVVRSDVFVFLFGGKGRACPHRLGRFFDEADFDLEYFPHDWFICCDRLGDSCRINFPVRMYSKSLPLLLLQLLPCLSLLFLQSLHLFLLFYLFFTHHETHLYLTSFLCISSCNPLTVIVSPSPTSTCVFPSLSFVLSRDPLQLLFLLYNLLAAFRSAVCILLQVGSSDRTPPVMELLTPSSKPLFSS